MTLILHAWPTPNAYKISLFLEEVGLDYEVRPVDIGAGDQFTPAFLALNPNNKMPVLVDSEGPDGQPITVWESGAILIYLGEKTGRFLSKDLRERYATLQWLMFQMGGVGPMFGQANHFVSYAPEKIGYAIDRYTNEAKRLVGVMDRRLGESRFLATNDYSIADMATYPWVRLIDRYGIDRAAHPHLDRWASAIEARPATGTAFRLLEERHRTGPMTDEQKKILFGIPPKA